MRLGGLTLIIAQSRQRTLAAVGYGCITLLTLRHSAWACPAILKEARRNMPLGPLEVILILVVVILLFGVGRIGKIGGELGKSIREFRKGLEGEDEKKAAAPSQPPADSNAGKPAA